MPEPSQPFETTSVLLAKTDEFTLSREEYVRAAMQAMKAGWVGQTFMAGLRGAVRTVRILWLVASLVLAVMCAWVVWVSPSFGPGGGGPTAVMLGVGVVAVSLAFAWRLRQMKTMYESSIRKAIDRGEITLPTRVRFWAAPSGLIVASERSALLTYWRGIGRIERLPDFLYVFVKPAEPLVIPARAIGESGFEAALIEALARHGPGRGEAVVDFAARLDAPCPVCGYSLRGTRSGICSECGAEPSVREIIQHAAAVDTKPSL